MGGSSKRESWDGVVGRAIWLLDLEDLGHGGFLSGEDVQVSKAMRCKLSKSRLGRRDLLLLSRLPFPESHASYKLQIQQFHKNANILNSRDPPPLVHFSLSVHATKQC